MTLEKNASQAHYPPKQMNGRDYAPDTLEAIGSGEAGGQHAADNGALQQAGGSSAGEMVPDQYIGPLENDRDSQRAAFEYDSFRIAAILIGAGLGLLLSHIFTRIF